MAETDFTLSHVGGLRLEEAGGASVRLSPLPPRALVNLRGRPAADGFAAAVERVVGAGLPDAPNRWSGGADAAIVWLGPDEWLIMAPAGQAADIESGLRSARDGDPWLSVVDVSHSYTGLVLTGTKAREVLDKGCPLDLHPRSFAEGDCAQTLVAQSRALLRATAPNTIEIWVRNSFARYLASWLIDAMSEFAD